MLIVCGFAVACPRQLPRGFELVAVQRYLRDLGRIAQLPRAAAQRAVAEARA